MELLFRRDITVLKSEKIFEYVLKKLAEETGTISQKLLATITDRIESRRNKGICDLVRYLENPNSYDQVVDFSPVNSLTIVLRILKMTLLKSPLQKSLKQRNLMTLCARQKINIWIVFKKTY